MFIDIHRKQNTKFGRFNLRPGEAQKVICLRGMVLEFRMHMHVSASLIYNSEQNNKTNITMVFLLSWYVSLR